MLLDPFAAPELPDGGLVELTPWGVVDVLEARAAEATWMDSDGRWRTAPSNPHRTRTA